MMGPEDQAEDAEDAYSLFDQIHTSVNISSKHFSREKYGFCDTKCWKVRADAVARGRPVRPHDFIPRISKLPLFFF